MIIDAAPLTMSMLFALVLRPHRVVRVPATATNTGTSRANYPPILPPTRNEGQQLDILNTLARPLLKQIASGEELSDAERTECASSKPISVTGYGHR